MQGVSVITAAFNAASSIERNIRSVAAQTLPVAEHIIIDDGSTDATAAIADELTRKFEHVRLISVGRQGAAKARNIGIEAARGRYIAFLDSDDFWRPQKLQSQLAFMSDQNVTFSYGDYSVIDDRSGVLLGRYKSPPSLGYRELLRGCPIGCLTVVFDQRALGKHYMPSVTRGQDWALWLSLTRPGVVARRYPGCHAVYARSANSLSSKKLRKIGDIYRVYREQEGLSQLRAGTYLAAHIVGALRKSY